MQLNTFSKLIGKWLLAILIFSGSSVAMAQNELDIYDLRFNTSVNCEDNLLIATLQIKAQSDTFRIGTSSILFNYDY